MTLGQRVVLPWLVLLAAMVAALAAARVARGDAAGGDATWLVLHAWALAHSDAPVPDGVEYRPGFIEALRAVAIHEEWIYPYEFGMSVVYARDLRDRLQGTPPLWTARVLPSVRWLDDEVAWANAHLEWCDRRAALEASPWRLRDWDDHRAEVRALRDGYRAASWAKMHANSAADPRRAADPATWYGSNPEAWHVRKLLAEARQHLGREAIETGILPPVVPAWRFQRVGE